MYWEVDEAYSVTPLHMVARFGLCDSLRNLLVSDRQGARVDINQKKKIGTTAVILAAASDGRVEAVRILLDHGADPSLENWYGNALHCAAEAGQSESIRELVARGMDPNQHRTHGFSPLACTLDNDQAEAFETLISCGANVNAVFEPQEGLRKRRKSWVEEEKARVAWARRVRPCEDCRIRRVKVNPATDT